jgi:arsenate reductase
MLKIYHNTRCGKSRCALQELESTTQNFQVIEYLKTPPSKDELKTLCTKMGKKPLDIVRQKEPVFQEKFKGKNLSDDEWIMAMVDNPILIERPIVVHDDKAWIARDASGLEEIQALRNVS